MSHLMISAAHKSSGKTTITIGLCAALSSEGLTVQPFKKGPDYIDPLWLSQAAGNTCYNLDYYTMERDEITALFREKMRYADIGIIEGNKGLYDGLDLEGANSNAALAAQLQAPVALVLDTRGMTRGIAPLILGYQAFDSDITIAGVILNNVGGSRHESKLRRVIEHYTDVRVVGAVPRNPDLEIVERHLGLMPSNEAEAAQERIDVIKEHVRTNVDTQALLTLANREKHEKILRPTGGNRKPELRIGYAKDAAFGFYYPDDLQALEDEGAEMVPFDTLEGSELPDVDALFIGGGFPETSMEKLAGNEKIRESVKQFIEQGGPAYAECGGLMYLCRSLSWEGKQCEMVGIIPADVKMHQKPQGRGYVRLCETDAHPWPQATGQGKVILAHEFHYSGLENLPQDIEYAYSMERGYGVDGKHDGIIYKNLLASYSHMRNVGSNHWARRFIAHVLAVKERDSLN